MPAFAETAPATNCNFKSTATHLLTVRNTRISVLLRFVASKCVKTMEVSLKKQSIGGAHKKGKKNRLP